MEEYICKKIEKDLEQVKKDLEESKLNHQTTQCEIDFLQREIDNLKEDQKRVRLGAYKHTFQYELESMKSEGECLTLALVGGEAPA